MAEQMEVAKDDSAVQGETGATSYHIKESTQGTSLEVKDFSLWYGQAQALFGINMAIQKAWSRL